MKGTCKQKALFFFFLVPIHPFMALVLAVSNQASNELREPLNFEGIECGENCQQPKLAYTLLENSLGKNSYWKKRKKKSSTKYT